MEISRETDDYIRESIEHTLGLPVSTQTLQLKLQASEQSLLMLRNQCLYLQSKLKEKDDIVERTRVCIFSPPDSTLSLFYGSV